MMMALNQDTTGESGMGREITVIGGGLAGLICARELALQGMKVQLLETSGRFGGKAGSDVVGKSDLQEHGYHIFPGWYLNTRALLATLKITLIDIDRFHYLYSDGRTSTVLTTPTACNLLRNIHNGILPVADAILHHYFFIDAIAEPMKRKAFLDRITRTGLLRSRWYANDRIARAEGENILKATSAPAYEVSAMTTKLVTSHWIRTATPFLSILGGDLQTEFIDPLVCNVKSLGVKLFKKERVVRLNMRNGAIKSVTGASGKNYHGHCFVIAVPVEAASKLISASIQNADPKLGTIRRLKSAAMAAIDLVLEQRLNELPSGHVFFAGGRYGLSFIDVSSHWNLTSQRLCFIASDFAELGDLPKADQTRLLLNEIQRYLPIKNQNISRCSFRSNIDHPLFLNTVGAWPNRPDTKSRAIPNLYFAGDWIKNPLDLACMEGAVWTAKEASRQIVRDVAGIVATPPTTPPQLSPALARLLKYLLLPIAAVAAIWSAWRTLKAEALSRLWRTPNMPKGKKTVS